VTAWGEWQGKEHKQMTRMRCLRDGFFWCPIHDNEEGVYCWACQIDIQLERINMERKRAHKKPIVLARSAQTNEKVEIP